MKEKEPLKVSFGFEEVSPEEKTFRVQEVFHRVARGYDVMNDAMSFGIHRLWKNAFVDQLPIFPGFRHLDMAGGTGDISSRIIKKALVQGLPGKILLGDLNLSMLESVKLPIEAPAYVSLACMDAQMLPLEAERFDSYTIAFGLRNITDQRRALCEAFRVLKPGGIFMCLEFSRPKNLLLQRCYNEYIMEWIPKMGKIFMGDRESYRYLAESIACFHGPETLKNMLEESGFENVSFQLLSGGVVAIHLGWKAS